MYFSTESECIRMQFHEHDLYAGLAHDLKLGRHVKQQISSEY